LSVDASRSWFRYHHLLADLLRLELRRTAPDEPPVLHRAASRWYEDNGFAVEAIHHAQAAQDWGQASRLIAEHSFSLHLDGQQATIRTLLANLPSDSAQGDPSWR
jgi:LuxR family maltose regulon positive regulatory protein